MDNQTCRVCGKTFDFDTEGLETLRKGKQFLVCSVPCAKKAATSKGKKYAIHDEKDDIVEHNIPTAPANIVKAKTGKIVG